MVRMKVDSHEWLDRWANTMTFSVLAWKSSSSSSERADTGVRTGSSPIMPGTGRPPRRYFSRSIEGTLGSDLPVVFGGCSIPSFARICSLIDSKLKVFISSRKRHSEQPPPPPSGTVAVSAYPSPASSASLSSSRFKGRPRRRDPVLLTEWGWDDAHSVAETSSSSKAAPAVRIASLHGQRLCGAVQADKCERAALLPVSSAPHGPSPLLPSPLHRHTHSHID